MQVLHKGKYSGNVIGQHADEGLICCHTSYDEQRFNDKRHFHQNAHLSLVISGNCTEKKKDAYYRQPGHVAFYQAGEPHQVLNVSNFSRHINLEIDPLLFKRYDFCEQNVDLAIRNSPDTGFLLLQIYREMQANDITTTLSIQAAFLKLVNGAAGRIDRNDAPVWVNRTEEYLRANLHNKITLSALSSAAGAHPVTLSKYFNKYWGSTLGQHIRKLKVEGSLSLLRSGKHSLSEVAFACGFADQSHFIRTFRQCTGLLPTQYRKISIR
jgi:AraC family transcriptional regulator